jgi:hypothetical protein
MIQKTISVKGHHLERIASLDIGFQEYEKLMLDKGYSTRASKSFATETYEFLGDLRENQEQKVLIIAGEPDFICEKCPESKRQTCVQYNPGINPLYKSIFWNPNMSAEGQDREHAENLGFKVGEKYSVKEIIAATKSQY